MTDTLLEQDKFLFLTLCETLTDLLSIREIMELVADAYSSYQPGSIVALRSREMAEEIEEMGHYLHEKYAL